MSGMHIPQPCPVDWQALTPTSAGWHCARCQHEVVDFTRLSEPEILAYLAARPGQRVCARLAEPARPVLRPPKGPRRWLLTALALLGASGLAARAVLPPRPLPTSARLAQPATGRVVVRGAVFDDSLGTPVAGAYVFIKGTRYGAVTDERGEFSLSVLPGEGLDRGGQLWLEVSAGHFTFVPQTLVVDLNTTPPPPLVVRLRSRPDRGHLKGKVIFIEPPVPPPGSRRK